MKIKQQKQIKEFLIKEFGNDGGNDLFVKQDKRLNEIIKGEKNKTESQMKTLAQTILPRIALYQVLLESELSQDDVNKSMRKYMLDVVAAKKHDSTAKMEKVPDSSKICYFKKLRLSSSERRLYPNVARYAIFRASDGSYQRQ